MSTGVREEAANTALSLILNEYGMESTSLIQLGRDIPDVYLVERGVRCILEMKRESNRGELPKQMGDRLNDGACEVVFGVIFPDAVTTGRMVAPTATQVKQNLRDANLEILVQAVSSDHELSRIENVSTSRLPAVIERYASEALDEGELDAAIERVSDAVSAFVTQVGGHPNADTIAQNINEVLKGIGDSETASGDGHADLTSGGLVLYDTISFYEMLCQSEDDLNTLRRHYRDAGTWKQALTNAFEAAYQINYDNIFTHTIGVLDALPTGPDIESALKELYDAGQYIVSRAGLLRQDLSGRIYHSALGKTLAKNFATYYTRIPSSDLLAWLAIDSWDDKVADFASGSGTFLNSAYSRKLSLALPDAIEEMASPGAMEEPNGIGTLDDLHRKFIEEDISALDAMSFASHLSMVNLATRRPRTTFRRSGVYHVPVVKQTTGENLTGSLELLKSNTIRVQERLSGDQRGARKQAVETAIGTEMEQVTFDRDYDVVIMNPPFSRKDRAAKILDMAKVNRMAREHNEDMTGQTGLAAPFVLLGDLHLKPGGRLALVLPTAVVNRYSWDAIREMLAENYHVEHMVVSWAPGLPAWSEDTDLREILIVARKLDTSENGNPGKTIVSHIDEDISFTEAREIGRILNSTNPSSISIRSPNSQVLYSGVKSLGEAKSYPSAFLTDHTDNWYRYAAYRNPNLVKLMAALEGIAAPEDAPYGVSLGDVTTPLNTDASVRLFLKNKKSAGYAYSDSEVSNSDPIIVTSRYDKISATPGDDGKWVYRDHSLPAKEKFEYGTGELLVMRRMDMYNTMRVCAIAPDKDRQFTGSMWVPVEISEMTTTDGERLLPIESARILAVWLNSTIGLIPYIGYRAETRGAFAEWKTNQVRRVTMLNPSKLTSDQANQLLDAYQDVADVEWDLLRNQLDDAVGDEDHPRRRLDRSVCDALMDKRPDIEAIERDLCDEVNKLGRIMNG